MRIVLVILVLVLGAAWADEDEANGLLTPDQEEQEALLDDMEDGQGRIDLARMLGDIFNGDVGENAESEEEEVATTEGRSQGDKSEAEDRLNAQALRQYNNLMDTLLRRINADARKLDPMMISIMPDKKGDTHKKDSGMNKKHRYPKNLNLDEAEDYGYDTEAIESEHHIERREINEEEEDVEEEDVEKELVEEGRRLSSSAEDEDENIINIQSRRIKLPKNTKSNKNSKKSNKNSKKRRNQNKKNIKKTGNKNNKKNSKNNKNNKNNRDNKKNKKRTGNRRPKSETDASTKNRKKNKDLPSVRTSRAEVTGFATLRRDGDIKIITGSNGITEIKTDLVTGPVNLKVTRKFGVGKDAITRIGNAASPQMKGSMVITLDAPGKKQKITKFQMLRPSIVTTHGSLAKEPSKRRDNNFLENTLPRATPVVTKKLLFVARAILNAN